MNEKQAKKLRKEVGYSTADTTEYVQVFTNKSKIYENASGELVKYGYTQKVKKDTPKYKYKQAKKLHKIQ